MSITKELREWAEDNTLQDTVLTTYPPQHAVHGVLETLLAIADRIDAEHERAMADAYLNGTPTDEKLAELGWVHLPVDADGEPWRLGDELMVEGEVCEVVGIGGKTIFYAFGDGVEWTIAHNNRHHHAPTVEDVLREFAEEMNQNLGMYTGEAIDADEWRAADAKTIAKFTAKLRLREDA